MEALSRKPLSPAFRMALLAGAMESVRLHLRSGSDVNAADEKGRSPLILAASRGRFDLCEFLLEEGADPGIRDHEGNDAVAVAQARGQNEIAALLTVAGTAVGETQSVGVSGENEDSETAVDSPSLSRKSDELIGPDATPSLMIANVEHISDASIQDGTGPASVLSGDDDVIDISAWQEETEGPPPPNDPTCADGAAALQGLISQHVPIDGDGDWDDVDIDLPESQDLIRRRTSLSVEDEQALRLLLVEALRDSRIHEDRISSVLPPSDDERDPASSLQTCLQFLLSDLGVEIDEDPQAPDVFLAADEDDEETFGDAVAEALAFLRRCQSSDADPFYLYVKNLPNDRLTRNDEIALGQAIEQGMLEVFTAAAASPVVVAKLLADAEAVLRGAMPARAIFDAAAGTQEVSEDDPADEDENDSDTGEQSSADTDTPSLSAGITEQLNAIIESCRRACQDPAELAARLFIADLARDYFTHLQQIACGDAAEVSLRERINAGLNKVEKAKRRLVNSNLRLVIWVAKRHGGLSLIDRIQEGNIGLMRAAERFDHRRGVKFATYAVWWIRQAITRAVADAGRIIRLPVHVHESLRKIERVRGQIHAETRLEPDAEQIANLAGIPAERVRKLVRAPDEPLCLEDCWDELQTIPDQSVSSPEEVCNQAALEVHVRDLLTGLEPRTAEILCMRFGIGHDEHTLEEIGQIYGVTRERIRQIEAKALRVLRNPARTGHLRGSV